MVDPCRLLQAGWPRRRAQTVALDTRWPAAAAQDPRRGAGVLPGNASLLPPSPTTGFPEREHAPCGDLSPSHSALPHALLGRRVWSGSAGAAWTGTTRGLVTAALRTSLVWGYAAHVGKGNEGKGIVVTPTFRQGASRKVVHSDRESDFCGLDALQAGGGPGFLLLSVLRSRRAGTPCCPTLP